jgi:hypothetical protein
LNTNSIGFLQWSESWSLDDTGTMKPRLPRQNTTKARKTQVSIALPRR